MSVKRLQVVSSSCVIPAASGVLILQAICGDGLLVVGEECDDGNQVLTLKTTRNCSSQQLIS